MVGHLKNLNPTFAQIPNRIKNAEFTTVSPTVANTMLVTVFIVLLFIRLQECLSKILNCQKSNTRTLNFLQFFT
jgi:hypothetical protein